MEDVHRNTRAFADLNRFLHRVEHAKPLVAHVRGIDATVFAHDFAQLDQVILGGDRTRRHHQGGRKAERAVGHRLADQLLHLLQLAGAGALKRRTHHAFPDRSFADIGGDVDRNARTFERGEIVVEPADLHRLASD